MNHHHRYSYLRRWVLALLSLAVCISQAAAGWEGVASLNEPRTAFAAVALGNRLYVFGGQGAADQAVIAPETLDLTNPLSWSSLTAPDQDTGGTVTHWSAAVIGNTWLVIGSGLEGSPPVRFTQIDAYDAPSDFWTQLSRRSVDRTAIAAAGGQDQLYVLETGPAGKNQGLALFLERYRPDTGNWRKITAYRKPLTNPAFALVGDTAYLIGGASSATGQP